MLRTPAPLRLRADARRAASRPAISASSSSRTTAAGRYKVTYVYEDGPADKDWVKVNVGDYLIAIGGKPVKAGDEYWELLNDRLNRKVEVTFNNKPSEDGAWKTRIETDQRPALTASFVTSAG